MQFGKPYVLNIVIPAVVAAFKAFGSNVVMPAVVIWWMFIDPLCLQRDLVIHVQRGC